MLLWGIDYQPWYPKALELQGEVSCLYQTYRKVASGRELHYSSDDFFLSTSLGASAFKWYGEVDLVMAKTRKRNFAMDSYQLEVRYQLMDDVTAENPVSLITGVVLGKATHPAVEDFSSFHHARCEAEMHVSIGKEFSCLDYWISRFWSVLALGVGDTGSPWIRFNVNWEKNHWDKHSWGLFMNSWWGLGGNNLRHAHDFEGYGPIAHRSIDLGASYRYQFDFGGKVTLSYAYRVYAKNFPQNASLVTLSFLYPFGI